MEEGADTFMKSAKYSDLETSLATLGAAKRNRVHTTSLWSTLSPSLFGRHVSIPQGGGGGFHLDDR